MEDRSKELVEYLTQSVLFGEATQLSEGISAEIWEKYLCLSTKLLRKSGDYIFRLGENAHGMYFIKKGSVKSSLLGKDGMVKTLSIKSERTILAEQFIFHQQPGIYEAIALGDCELYFFPRELVLQLMKRDFEVTLFIAKTLAISTRMLAHQIQDMSTRNVSQSLARILYTICCYEEESCNPKGDGVVSLSHEELANMLGAHRVTVTKILHQFKKMAILDYKYEKIHVIDRQRLKDFAST